MRQKLLKIAGESDVEKILDCFVQLKLLNDAEYAYNFAFCRVGRQGWGPVKIRSALVRRRVDPDDIDAALDRIRKEIGENYGLAEYLNRYCGKRGIPEDPKSLRNLVSHLRRRGFHSDSIHSVLKEMQP